MKHARTEKIRINKVGQTATEDARQSVLFTYLWSLGMYCPSVVPGTTTGQTGQTKCPDRQSVRTDKMSGQTLELVDPE